MLHRQLQSNLSTNEKLSDSVQQLVVKKLGPKFVTWLSAMVKTYSPKSTALGVATSAYLTKHGLSVKGRNGLAGCGTGLSEATRWRLDNTVISLQRERQQRLMKTETVIHSFDNLHRHRGLYKLKPGKGNMVLLDWTVFCLFRLPKFVTIPRFQVPDGADFRKAVPNALLFGPLAATYVVGIQEEASALLQLILKGEFFQWTFVSKEYFIDRPRSTAKGPNGHETTAVGAGGAPRVLFASHAGAVLGEMEPTVATNTNSNSNVGVEANVKTLFATLGKTAEVGEPLFYDALVSDIAIWQPLLLAQFSACNPCPLLFSSLILYWDEFHWIKVRLKASSFCFQCPSLWFGLSEPSSFYTALTRGDLVIWSRPNSGSPLQ